MADVITYLLLGAMGAQFDYREYQEDGDRLLQEKGGLTGWYAQGGLRTDALELELQLQKISGKVDYRGHTNLGLPLLTDTDETLETLRLSGALSLFEFGALQFRHQLQGYLAGQYREWHRDILPTRSVSGLVEDYAWSELYVGGRWSAIDGPLRMGFTLAASKVLNPRIEVELNFAGVDTILLEMKGGYGALAEFSTEYALSDAVVLHGVVAWQHWEFDTSAWKSFESERGPLRIREPESHSALLMLQTGLSWRF